MKEKIDFEKISQEILQGLKEKKPLIGEGGVFTPLIKHFLYLFKCVNYRYLMLLRKP